MPGGRGNVASRHWFQECFGFEEGSYKEAQASFEMEGDVLRVKKSGLSFHVGPFETPSLEELRARLAATPLPADLGGLSFRNMVGNARAMHMDSANAGAVFQVASQFNCLEMNEPGARPESGVTRYYSDATQGPACALSCPAGTVFRNYFTGAGGHKGQGGGHQIDCMSAVGNLVQNAKEGYWKMQNGYLLPIGPGSIGKLSKRLDDDPSLAEMARSRLQVGIHWDTEVKGGQNRVCQVFSSALPVSYAKSTKSADWASIGQAVLDATFEATLSAGALLAAERRQRVTVYLTAVGGGAFGNRSQWIISAIDRALTVHANSPIDVRQIHFASKPRGAFETLETRARRGPTGGSGPAPVASPPVPPAPVAVPANSTPAQRITSAFARFDANGDGVIDKNELVSALQALAPDGFSNEQLDRLFDAADSDSDGVVHYAEFAAWICDEDSAIASYVLAHGDGSEAEEPQA